MPTAEIVFLGSSKYSCLVAEDIFNEFGLAAVVTAPDARGSRGRAVRSPVKAFGIARRIPVIEAAKLTEGEVERVRGLAPDFLVVADYGLILPHALLSLPRYAPLNVHHSLLPKYRGPSPAPAAILNGDAVTGVSVIVMTDKVDAGDVLTQVPYSLKPNETTDSLLSELNRRGGQAVVSVIEQYLSGTAHPKKQNEFEATYTRRMSRDDGRVDLGGSPELNWRKIRAYGDWPGTYFVAAHAGNEIRVKIKSARYEDGSLIIERVIPENRREMDYKDFLKGLR